MNDHARPAAPEGAPPTRPADRATELCRRVRAGGPFVRYGLALAITALAILLRTALGELAVTRAPFGLYHLFVLAVAVLAGRGPGLLSAGLTALWAVGFGSASENYPQPSLVDTLAYLTSSFLVAVIGDGLLRARFEVERRAAEERGAQERLGAALRRLDLHVSHSPLAVVEWDQGVRVVRWSGAAAAIFGWTEAEVIGRHIGEIGLVYDDDVGAVSDVSARLYGGEVQHLVSRNRNWTKDGRVLFCDWYNSVVLGERGEVQSVLSFVLDVTAQRETEAALRESEARFRTLADSSPNVIWVTDRTGRIEFVNAAYGRFFGVVEKSVKESGWQPLLHPDDAAAYTAAFAAAVRERTPFRARTRVRRADGAWRWIDSSGQPRFDARGDYAGHVGSSPDVTEIEEARAAAERAALQRDEFLANVSHELRTPLNGILGWAQVLARTAALDPAAAKGVAAIERGARAQAQLIDDLLDLNRIVSGRFRLDMQETDLEPVLEAALDTVRPAAEAKGVRLVTRMDAAPGLVTGDPSRLQQVAWNLLSNSVKFTPSGGEVRLALRRADDAVEIEVSDNGRGIRPEFLPRVFDRFRQEDATTTRGFGGLGLGLAIVRHIVELHGGTVAAESPGEGLGATFRVRLPAHAAAVRGARIPDAGTTAAHAATTLAGVSVLVVDDEPDACELARAILATVGASVACASSAAAALAQLSAGTPDVLLSDIAMPGTDGYELIRLLRRRGETLPAVALTAFARSEDRVRALSAGFNHFIAKPIDAEELIAVVEAAVRDRRRATT